MDPCNGPVNKKRGFERMMTSQPQHALISVMVAVTDASAAVAWYKEALGATENLFLAP